MLIFYTLLITDTERKKNIIMTTLPHLLTVSNVTHSNAGKSPVTGNSLPCTV